MSIKQKSFNCVKRFGLNDCLVLDSNGPYSRKNQFPVTQPDAKGSDGRPSAGLCDLFLAFIAQLPVHVHVEFSAQ